ncbi:MAG: long-chain fatty acid--CoA ligase [Actinomycetota bacterium]|nr:long-chain fatty acid--CoA ligase [Actinomycetota bacterium]
MRGTMQDYPLTIAAIVRHGINTFGDAVIVSPTDEGSRTTTFRETAQRAGRLAGALRRLGVAGDDRVATFAWNNQAHVEAYLAVPSMGAVLHTLNIRLFPEQVVYIANHAEDKVVLVDASLVGTLAKTLPEMKTVEHVVVVGETDTSALGAGTAQVHDYESLLAAEQPDFDWADVEETDAAALCYTSGTTGNPKGVAYSHRSTYLHSLGICHSNVVGLAEGDRVLPVVPMFHANAWGLVYAAFMSGADIVLPDRFLQAAPLTALIAAEKVTVTSGVPTIWNDVLQYARANPVDLSSLRTVTCGGSAVPRSLMEAYDRELGITVTQGWGMTETSPVASMALPPKTATGEDYWRYRDTAGRVIFGVEARITADDGSVLPADGRSVGEIEVRGPWITGSYFLDDAAERFHDGWLRTGDVGTLDGQNFLRISDRAKDVIKSGGEWISSVELENVLMAHPDVLEAAVVGVPDEKWGERPLAGVVLRPGADVSLEALREHLAGQIARWQVPERWAKVPEIPKTSVGKFDKKVLRARYGEGELDVTTL